MYTGSYKSTIGYWRHRHHCYLEAAAFWRGTPAISADYLAQAAKAREAIAYWKTAQ